MNNEDIKVLEEYVQEFNENKKKYKLAYSTGFGKFWSNFVKAIENLINRNKQLEADNYEQNNIINNYIEIEKEHKKENGELRERIKELEMQLLEKDLHIDGLKEDRRIAVEEIQEQYFVSKDKLKKVADDYESKGYIEIAGAMRELLEEGDDK